jgi:glyoxylase-like metal-dependent hydrolase (beta-lactamase superfamily II)
VTYPTSVPFTSRHFHLEQLAQGVYAAISIDGTGSMSNAGIIDLGGTTLIFDTFGTPQAAQDLRAAAEQLLGQPIAYVVNSHRHGDHFWGNQVFHPAATIIATERTRADILMNENMSREEMQREIENDIREFEAKRAREQDDAKRRSQAAEIATRRELLSAISTFERTLPDLTFEQQLTFHGSQRTVELLTYGGGHTASDAFLYLPADRLLFMGDLLFVRVHPWIGHGDPQEWQAILQRIEQFDFTIAVPGHGPLGSREDLALNRGYLASCLALAEQCMGEGLPLEEATGRKLPAPFDAWEGAEVFDWNMAFLYNRAK